MTQEELLKQINPLARKKREGNITEEELKKLNELREEYLKGFRAMLNQTLESTVIQYPDGSKVKLTEHRKEKK